VRTEARRFGYARQAGESGDPFGALRLLRAGSSLRLKYGYAQDDAE
jgi:hypothetical protein